MRDILNFSYIAGIKEAIEGQTNLEMFGLLEGDSDWASEDEFDPP